MAGPGAAAGLARLAALCGVETSHRTPAGRLVRAPADTLTAVLAALGVPAGSPARIRESLESLERRRAARLLPPHAVLTAGDPLPALGLPPGTALTVRPADAGEPEAGDAGAAVGPGGPPPGCHTLRAIHPDGRTEECPLVVAPGTAPGPARRGFGLMVQLPALLSERSWGMGDLADLAALARWAAGRGADFVTVNPLHSAVPPGPDADPSPYRPSSRRFPDPVHLRVEDVPEYRRLPPPDRVRVGELLARAAGLREEVLARGGLVDRAAVWRLKRAALEPVCRVPLEPVRRAGYEAFAAERGRALEDHATWCALAEEHGTDWRSWPPGLRDPRSAATGRARAALADRVAFHRRLAWLTDGQLAGAQRAARDAGAAVGVVHDLAVGSHPSGADAWALRDLLAPGMSIGAPPDDFNRFGQDWGLPPWRPDALAAAGYVPYRDLLRGVLRHAGGVRIDHVAGLFRQWWVPHGRPPTEGAYVRYDADALLAVLVLEACRAGAVVIGEDLGTVAPGVRERLAARGVLGTNVLWFERDPDTGGPLPPERWRRDCLAALTTHDLPSTAARLTGEHVALRHRLGLLTGPLTEERAADTAELAEWLALLDDPPRGARPGPGPPGGPLPSGDLVHDPEPWIRALYRLLARAPARLLGVWLPDLVGDRRPHNVPGTSDAYPNWRLPVADFAGRPVTLEELTAAPRARALLAGLRRALGGPA